MSKMTLSEELAWRGFVQQTTLKNLGVLDQQQLTFYHGYDASADSQTVGNLAAMMLDKLFIRHGHKAIILAGGATSLIGDPGGKNQERQLKSEDEVAKNISKAEAQLKTIFANQQFRLVNNLDWTKEMDVISFLRDIGKHFSMTPLVQRDYIAKRIGPDGNGISYTEFSYTLLQGMDFLHLYDTEQVTLQLGGSDQWGNCLSGVDLVRRARGVEVNVLTHPLVINAATGEKFGKSEAGAVWLDAAKTPVHDFYQFWLNADDTSAEQYLKIFTELDITALDEVMKQFNNNKGERFAQKTLAYEVTKLVHGQPAAEQARNDAQKLFGAKTASQPLSKEEFQELGLPVYETVIDGSVVDALVNSELAASKTEARHFLEVGAVYINDQVVSANKQNFQKEDFSSGYLILRRGKKTQVLVKVKLGL